jgi:hypothetical protein
VFQSNKDRVGDAQSRCEGERASADLQGAAAHSEDVWGEFRLGADEEKGVEFRGGASDVDGLVLNEDSLFRCFALPE